MQPWYDRIDESGLVENHHVRHAQYLSLSKRLSIKVMIKIIVDQN